MDLRTYFTQRALQALQDPRVAAIMRDERVSRALMNALRLRGKVQRSFDERVDALAKTLNLATKREVRELRRTIRRLEDELRRSQRNDATD